jgi:hypothetical protein
VTRPVFLPLQTGSTGSFLEAKAMGKSGDPLSGAPLSEIWGTILGGYLAAFGFALVTYDCLLTLDDEVGLNSTCFNLLHLVRSQKRLVWPGPIHLPKILYYINRYLSIITLAYNTYGEWHRFPVDPSIPPTDQQKYPASTHHSPSV